MPAQRPMRHHLAAAVALVVVAASLGGCLQMASRPTPTPLPTPLPSPSPLPTPTPTPGPATPTPMPTFTTYTVRPGDSLTSIARKFRTTPRSLAYWNRDTYRSLDPESAKYAPNNLQVGWVLKVLPGGLYSPPPAATDSGLDVTPAPTEYLGPPTAPPSGSPGPSVAPSASPGG